MNAPEKVYRTTTYLNSERGNTVWKNHPVAGAENVEYVRKDVFIEKSQNFFHQSHYLFNLDGMELHNFIEDFRKAMKGE